MLKRSFKQWGRRNSRPFLFIMYSYRTRLEFPFHRKKFVQYLQIKEPERVTQALLIPKIVQNVLVLCNFDHLDRFGLGFFFLGNVNNQDSVLIGRMDFFPISGFR